LPATQLHCCTVTRFYLNLHFLFITCITIHHCHHNTAPLRLTITTELLQKLSSCLFPLSSARHWYFATLQWLLSSRLVKLSFYLTRAAI